MKDRVAMVSHSIFLDRSDMSNNISISQIKEVVQQAYEQEIGRAHV